MTPVLMEFLTSTGAPVGFAGVEIRLTRSDYQESIDGVLMPRLINVVTGMDGKALVNLMPSNERYHVTVYDTFTDAALHHHFYVPILNSTGIVLRLQDLIVPDDYKLTGGPFDSAVLVEIIAAKANVLAARDATFAARDEAVHAAQFADDSIQVTEDARDVSVTASLVAVAARDIVAANNQAAHDSALLAEDRAASALQSMTRAIAEASASLASATASAASATAASNSAYEADRDANATVAARDVATGAANDAHHDALVAENARIISLAARDVAVTARDTAVLKADQLASQLYAFNEIYIGKFAVAPSKDGNGNPLKVGAIYENTVQGKIYQWESDLAWHPYDEESQLQLNNATLAASNAAASATAALQRQNAAAASATAALASQNAAAASNTAAQDAALRAYQDQLVSTASKDTAVAAKDTATQKAAAAAQSAADAAAALAQQQAGQVQADWTQADTASKAFIKNKPLLAAVATSGNKADVGLGQVDNTADTAKPVSSAQQVALNTKVDYSLGDAFNGFPRMAGYKINIKNAAGTVQSYLNSVAGTSRIWNFPDKDGTVAMLSDLTGLNSGTNSGDETRQSILDKLGVPSISGTNTGDQTAASLGLGNVTNTSDANKPVSTAQQAALNLKANITYVDAKVAALVDSSPAALDTLKELATALGNDANFSTSMTNSLAGKAPLNGAGAYGYWNIGVAESYKLLGKDTRDTVRAPFSFPGSAIAWDFMAAATDGLNDPEPGGSNGYHGVLTLQQWTDKSGGGTKQLAFTNNDQMWLRGSGVSDTTYGPWKLMMNHLNVNQYAPTLTGGNASGTWAINITGLSGKASTLSSGGGNSTAMTFNWQGNGGGLQPTWLWGGFDGQQMYVYNPANFSVANANTLGGIAPDAAGNGNTVAVRDPNGCIHSSWQGFGSETYQMDVRNPIWRFLNSPGFGISYYQGQAGLGGVRDGIGIHFGNTKLAAADCDFYFDQAGVMYINKAAVLTAANADASGTPSTIVRRDGNADIYGRYLWSNYFNASDEGTNGTEGTVTAIITKRGDNFYRSTKPTSVKAFLNVNGADIYQNRADVTFDIGFAKELRWKNFGNGHSIFDASNGTAPNGATISRVDSDIRWASSYPTLMGWNGSATYGVRVDRAAYAENLTGTLDGSKVTGTVPNASNAGQAAAVNGLTIYPRVQEDWNGAPYRNTGFYANSGQPGNVPYPYASMITAANSDVGMQIAGGYNADNLWFRSWYNGGGNYLPWRKVIHEAIIGQYAAGSAPRLTGPAYTNGTDGWFRTQGNAGWYNETYAVGVYSSQAGWVFTYNNASFAANQVRANAGSAANPAFHFQNDTDTGLFSQGDGYLSFAVNAQLVGYWVGSTLISQGDIGAVSDPRLKKNWVDLPKDFIERWAEVQHGTYERIDTGIIQVGLNAKDVFDIIPEATPRDKKGYLALNYSQAAAVATVQLSQRVVQLEDLLRSALERIDALENQ